jgi:dihydrofolate reductase
VFDVVIAADRGWGIGKANALPWPKLRADQQHFRRMTNAASPGKRNAIVMGRKTWDSAEIASRPLPNRLNVVVSRGEIAVPPGVLAVHSLDEALAVVAALADVEHTFLVSGAGLLAAALTHPELRYVYLTRVDATFDCDVRIPELDTLGFVHVQWDGEFASEDGGVRYRVERLTRPTVP